jgi:hypothetical protein
MLLFEVINAYRCEITAKRCDCAEWSLIDHQAIRDGFATLIFSLRTNKTSLFKAPF